MFPQVYTKEIQLNDGRTITIETGKLAKQADGSVVVKLGNTMLLATVVSAPEAKPGVDFMPLSVDYQEKYASNGRIPGGFLRREGKLSDSEVLVSRLVDRAMRPLFPDDYHADTQINITLISADTEVLPDQLAALAASAAISVSDIPFNGPISEVRVIKTESGEYIVNPTTSQMEAAVMDLMVGASAENILMVEGEMKEVQEEEMLEALKLAHEEIKKHCAAIKELESLTNKTVKRTYSHEENKPELKEAMSTALFDKLYAVAKKQNPNKKERSADFKQVLEEYIASYPAEQLEEDEYLIKRYFHSIQKEAVRSMVVNDNVRLDGRKLNEIRPIWSEINYLPSAHGSAVFTRGETQSLTTCTLGTKMDEQMIDSVMFQGTMKFMLHYNFPGFSTGEVKPNRGPGRREVGHGNLAFRALKNVIPQDETNPYTIRIVSDILESNGSSSMATVCAGTLSLMDAGVKISAPVSGIAMGLIAKDGKFAVLSDILGDEDHLGDMDFKVTGTEKGITATQMDMKVEGLSYEVLTKALLQARDGRLHILNKMKETIQEPREDYKPHAPRVIELRIPKELIGAVIGPGGKIIQEIQKTSGATVTIEEVNDSGIVKIFGKDKQSIDTAHSAIKGIVTLPEVGESYVGKVKSIQPFGAFIEFLPNKDGLLHISEIKWERVESMDGVLEIGEEVKVKLIEIDKKTGKYRLSRKALIPKPVQSEEKAKSQE